MIERNPDECLEALHGRAVQNSLPLFDVDRNYRKGNLLIEDEFGIDTDGLFVWPNGRRSGSQSIPGMGGSFRRNPHEQRGSAIVASSVAVQTAQVA